MSTCLYDRADTSSRAEKVVILGCSTTCWANDVNCNYHSAWNEHLRPLAWKASNRRDLLQSVHKTRDYAIHIFVRTAQLLDFIDGVKDGSVVLAAKLAANLRQ